MGVESALEDVARGLDAEDLREDVHGTALHRAAFAGDVAAVSSLCARGAAIEARNPSYQQTPLHLACAKQHVFVVRLLLAARADLDAKDQDGFTPMDLLASSS